MPRVLACVVSHRVSSIRSRKLVRSQTRPRVSGLNQGSSSRLGDSICSRKRHIMPTDFWVCPAPVEANGLCGICRNTIQPQ